MCTGPDRGQHVGSTEVRWRFISRRIDLPDGWIGYTPSEQAPARQGTLEPPALRETFSSLVQCLARDPSCLPGYEIWKCSGHGMVFTAHWPTPTETVAFVAKQSRATGPWHQMRNLFAPSREHRNYRRALALLAAGVNTAVPLALFVHRRRRQESWLLTRFVPNLVDLDHVAVGILPRMDAQAQYRLKKAISDSVVDLLRRLDRSRLEHRDLKASNVLLENRDGTLDASRLWLLDLDGLAPNRCLGGRRRWKPVVRLAASLRGYSSVSRSDYCRFLKSYLRPSQAGRGAWRPRFRRLQRRVHRYLDASTKRKTGKLDGYGGD